MTKPQPCVTNLPPSRLCRLLVITFVIKLTVLGMLIVEPALPGFGFLPDESASTDDAGRAVAIAATGAGAPPPIEAGLPDAGMRAPQAAGGQSGTGLPPAVPGVSSPEPPASGPEQNRALPAIASSGASQALAPATGNGTQRESLLAPDVRDGLARRQEDLARKEQELRVLENELAARLERMQILENRLSEMIKDAEETGDAKFRHLVDVLSNMKSKQAAAVLETLDPKIAVRVLAGMRGRQAGEILTFVKPEIAAKLSESLARMQLPLQ
ncbi:MAG: hypothetical protein LBH65_05430 [Desulfovibrio sp.]|jgi:hypothetical protein|nr:hypothetical protein [Desulfovibrio sp.]